MAVVAAPIAATGIGAVYLVTLSKTYSLAANYSAKRLFGIDNAYPSPFWKPWFQPAIESNSTVRGNFGATLLALASFGLQRRLIWRHLGNSLRLPQVEQEKKIATTSQFIKIVGPGIVEVSANAFGTCLVVGLAKPLFDGNNMRKHI